MRAALFLCAFSLSAVAVIASPPAPQDASERVALALYEGRVAASAPRTNRKKLSQAVQTLAILGARPADPLVPDIVAVWQAKADPSARAAPPYRGRILGPAYRNGNVTPGIPSESDQLFLGGLLASLSIAPAKGARLGLAVLNAKGDKICANPVREPASTCRWVPTYSERVHIRIENLGTAPSGYFLVVN